MDVASIIADSYSGWQVCPPPSNVDDVNALIAGAPLQLPEEYLQLIRLHNGGEGELGANPGWFQYWPTEKVLEHNLGYQLPEWLPGFFGFGSNGGGELFAIDFRGQQPFPVVMIPFAFDINESIVLAEDFAGFVRLLGRHYDEDFPLAIHLPMG